MIVLSMGKLGKRRKGKRNKTRRGAELI